ncbi:MAG: sigma-70 family RNA polymerase sigma factor [Chloroflexi bacterium]|nr:sigma-70 family RNA polymerase sigma factor [Chloroflexota bacterium]
MNNQTSARRPASNDADGKDVDSTSADGYLLEQLRFGPARAEAFEMLFHRHYQRIYRLLYRLVGDEADDLAQETFLRLHRRPPREPDTDLEAWLYRVAINLAYNALRSRRRREHYRDLWAALADVLGRHRTTPEPGRELERRQEAAEVRGILAALGARDAGILALRYSGLSYQEIAGTLGVAPGSVGTLLARAERRFKAAYEAHYARRSRDEAQGGEHT